MEGLCPCGHEPTGSIVPVSWLVSSGILTTDETLKLISAFERIRPLLRSTFQMFLNFINKIMKTIMKSNKTVK